MSPGHPGRERGYPGYEGDCEVADVIRRGLSWFVPSALCASALVVAQIPASPATRASVGRAVERLAAGAPPLVVWQLKQRTFDPAKGTDTISHTFVPTTSCYQVYVTLVSSGASDVMYVQLGTSAQDASEIQSGEEHFFVACHVQPGVMPVLRAIPVPSHNYAGRSLTYALAVLLPMPVPISVDGISAGTATNALLLRVSKPANYTVHYHLDSGSVSISAVSGSTVTSTGKVGGDGGITTRLQTGLTEIVVQPEPQSGESLHWTIEVGIAPEVRKFSPPDGAVLKQAPRSVTVQASAPGRIVLDRLPVSSHYDAATGLVSFDARQPLAAGIHIVEVVGADGTLAASHATFRVMPPLSLQPPRTPAGTVAGQAWVSTSTPDGRYTLQMPSSWKMAAHDGTVLLAEPHGEAFVQASERMLGDAINASQVAHAIASHFPGTPQFSTIGAGASFSTTLTGKNGVRAKLLFLVSPSLAQHSLLLAVGLSTGVQPALAEQVAAIMASFKANGDAGVRQARVWLHYQHGGFNLDYPAGWMADLTSTDLAVLVGPFDQAYVVGEDLAYSGSASSATSRPQASKRRR